MSRLALLALLSEEGETAGNLDFLLTGTCFSFLFSFFFKHRNSWYNHKSFQMYHVVKALYFNSNTVVRMTSWETPCMPPWALLWKKSWLSLYIHTEQKIIECKGSNYVAKQSHSLVRFRACPWKWWCPPSIWLFATIVLQHEGCKEPDWGQVGGGCHCQKVLCYWHFAKHHLQRARLRAGSPFPLPASKVVI